MISLRGTLNHRETRHYNYPTITRLKSWNPAIYRPGEANKYLDYYFALMMTYPTIAAALGTYIYTESTFHFQTWSEVETFAGAIGNLNASYVQSVIVAGTPRRRKGKVHYLECPMNCSESHSLTPLRNLRCLRISLLEMCWMEDSMHRMFTGSFDKRIFERFSRLHTDFPLLKHEILITKPVNDWRGWRNKDDCEWEIRASPRELTEGVSYYSL